MSSFFTMPPLPEWEGLHPLVVHFPIALLMVAPLFALLGFLPRVGQGFRLAALALLILGTVASYVAVESGEASARVISFSPEARETLEKHEELAETTALLFLVLTICLCDRSVAPLACPPVPTYDRSAVYNRLAVDRVSGNGRPLRELACERRPPRRAAGVCASRRELDLGAVVNCPDCGPLRSQGAADGVVHVPADDAGTAVAGVAFDLASPAGDAPLLLVGGPAQVGHRRRALAVAGQVGLAVRDRAGVVGQPQRRRLACRAVTGQPAAWAYNRV